MAGRIRKSFARILKKILRIIDKPVVIDSEEIRLKRFPRFTSTTTVVVAQRISIVDAASFLSMREEIFQREIYKFKSSKDSPTIIDCGANIGLSVLYFKTLFPRCEIIAFEPDYDIFKVLSNNVKEWHMTNVKLLQCAVWSSQGKLTFLADGADAGRIVDSSKKGGLKEVATVRLRDYLNKPLDFLKLDIEGAELVVLRDCVDLLVNVKNLFVEYHSFTNRTQELDELLSILKNAGFRYLIQQHGVVSNTPFTSTATQDEMDILLNISAFRNEERV